MITFVTTDHFYKHWLKHEEGLRNGGDEVCVVVFGQSRVCLHSIQLVLILIRFEHIRIYSFVALYSKTSNIVDILVGVCSNNLPKCSTLAQHRCSYFFPRFIPKRLHNTLWWIQWSSYALCGVCISNILL